MLAKQLDRTLALIGEIAKSNPLLLVCLALDAGMALVCVAAIYFR